MNNIKRQLSIILSLIMVIGTFTMSAYALDDVSDAVDESQPVAAQEEPEEADAAEEAVPEETAEEDEEPAVEEMVEEEPQVQEEEQTVVKAEADGVINNVVFSDATATSVKVSKGSDFPVAAMDGVKFVEAADDTKAVSVEVADALEAGVTVEGLTQGTMYAVYATDGAEDVLLGYYVNTGLAATKKYVSTTLNWTVDGTADLNVAAELTKDGEAVEAEGTEYVDSEITGGTENVYGLLVKVTVGDSVYAAANEELKVTPPVKPVLAKPVLKGEKYKAAQYDGKGDSKVISSDQVRLTWKAVSGASKYQVYKYDMSVAKWVLVYTTSAKTYTVKKLKNGHQYRFRIRALKTTEYGTVYSSYSSYVGKYTIKYLTVKPHAIYYDGVITATAKAFKTKSSKAVVTKLKTGTKGTVLQRAGGRSQIMLSNGKVYWVNRSKCHYTKQRYNSKKDWTTSAKEGLVKYKSSKTKYIIWISQYTQRVNVYQGKKGSWKLIKTGLCATGKMERKTPMGTFKVGQKEKGWFYPGYKNAPVVHFAARNSFHSRPTYYSGKVKTKTIGKPASNGCVRMEQPYVDWIYKYIPKGTKVISW